MGAHVNNVHYIDDLSQWVTWYGSFESNLEQKIYHQCALCASPKFFLVDLVEIAKHMKLHQSITPKIYIDRYFNNDSSLKIVKDISSENNKLPVTPQLPITPKPVEKINIPPSVTLKMISTSATSSASKIVAKTPSKKSTTSNDPMTPPFSPAVVSPTVASRVVSTPSSVKSSSSSVFMSPSNSPGTVKLSMRRSVKKEKIDLVKTSPVKRSNTEKNSTNKKRITEETTSPALSDVSDRSSADLIEKVKGGNYTTEDLLAAVACLI